MKLHKCKAVLTLVQVDHLSGELLGSAWDHLTAKGAKNIQILSALTKKGRPGQLLLIDAPVDRLPELEEYLVTGLGVSGWHRIPTEHVYIGTEVVNKELIFHMLDGDLSVTVQGKRILDHDVFVRPEHDDCVRVQEQLRRECNYEIVLRELERVIAEALNRTETEVEINLRPHRESQTDEGCAEKTHESCEMY